MKKSILLIAPLAFLWSCSPTSEIFDDAYNGAETEPVVQVNEEEGYADYIKKEEGNYHVVVDSGDTYRSGLNPSYYNSTRKNDPYQYGGFAANNNPNYYNSSSMYSCTNQLGWDVCPIQCDVFFDGYRCKHIRARSMSLYGWGYTGFYPMGWQYNNGCSPNYNGYFGYSTGNYWNTFYGSPYWTNQYGMGYGNFYGSNYYGYGWNSYYGSSWNNGYGWGYGGYSPWGYSIYNSNWNNNTNNNNSNWGETPSSTSNYHYGHRGGTNTGSYSQNSTNYEHTVKAKEDIQVSNPFPLYSSLDQNEAAVNVFESKPVKPIGGGNTFNGSAQEMNDHSTITNQIDKPDYVNTNSVNEQSGSFITSQPVYTANTGSGSVNKTNTITSSGKTTTVSNNSTAKPMTQKVVRVGKPAQNQFSGGNNVLYGSNSSKTGSYSSNSSNRTYDNPNKYSSPSKVDYSNTNSGTVYTSGSNTSNSRRTNNSSNTNTTNNSGSNNRRTSPSTNYGNRSSSSGSSGSSSSSGSTSRRR